MFAFISAIGHILLWLIRVPKVISRYATENVRRQLRQTKERLASVERREKINKKVTEEQLKENRQRQLREKAGLEHLDKVLHEDRW